MSTSTTQESAEITPTLAKKMVKNVNDIEEQIENDFNRIKQSGHNIEDKIVTVFLGPTGSGKTTLYYALTGKQLKGSKTGPIRRLNAAAPEKNFKIGNTGLAETIIPGIEYDQGTDMIFCDCPGFFDNRGEIQDITNSFAICRVLSQAKNVKILLLVSITDIFATHGKALRECCNIVERLIPDKQSLKPAIALIVTHVSHDDIGETFLDDVYPGNGGWLLKYFKDNESGNNKVVYCFPSPSTEEIRNQSYTSFNREPILNFIRNSPPTHIVPFVSLSSEAKLMILSVVDSFGCLSNIIQSLVLRMQDDSTSSDENLDLWKDRVEKFSQNKYPTPKDLVDKAREIINPSTALYDRIYESLMKIQNWRSFLELIVKDELTPHDQVLYRQSQLMKPVFLDITDYFGKLLSPLHSLLIAKIQKRDIERDTNAAFEQLKEAKEKEENALRERDEQRKLTEKMNYDMQLLVEKQKTEIERYKMQIELEKQRAQLIAQYQPKPDNGPAYITALAPILQAIIERKKDSK